MPKRLTASYMTWKEIAWQLRCSQVSTTSQEPFFKIMVFGLSVLLLQSRTCFKCSVPDCHCQSTSWGTSSLAQRLSQIAWGTLPTSEQRTSDFKPKNSENNEKNSKQLQEKCRLNTAHSCFISWMGRFAANCKLFIYWYQNFLYYKHQCWMLLKIHCFAISETFSQDWKFPSCKKHFLFLKDCIFLKTECRKIICCLLQSF